MAQAIDEVAPRSRHTDAASLGVYKYDRERKLGHRRIGESGQVTYKKIETTQLMGSIQLGIQYSVSDRVVRFAMPTVDHHPFPRRWAVWPRSRSATC